MCQEAHPEVREGSGGPPRGHRGVGRGCEADPEVRGKSEGPPGGPVGIVRPTQRSEKPTRRSGRGRESHLDVREGSGCQPELR